MSIGTSQKFAIVAGALSAAVSSAASAGLITFTYSGIASGTWSSGIYSGQTFTNQAFTITGTGLTEQRSAIGAGLFGGYSIQHGPTSISIAGYSVFVATSNLFTQTDPEGGMWLVAGSIQGNYVLGTSGPSSWNMLTSLPAAQYGVSYPGVIFPTISTSFGGLQFTSFGIPITFGAQVVPAPGAVALLGLAGLAGRRRR
jgi:MYXO-CTERM domain-containing protein